MVQLMGGEFKKEVFGYAFVLQLRVLDKLIQPLTVEKPTYTEDFHKWFNLGAKWDNIFVFEFKYVNDNLKSLEKINPKFDNSTESYNLGFQNAAVLPIKRSSSEEEKKSDLGNLKMTNRTYKMVQALKSVQGGALDSFGVTDPEEAIVNKIEILAQKHQVPKKINVLIVDHC